MRIRSAAHAMATVLLVTACGGGASAPSAAPSAARSTAATAATPAPSYPTKAIDIMAPAGPGGGFDTTARLIQKALTDDKLVSVTVSVSNKPGAGGVTGMGELINNAKGDPYRLIVIGRVTLGAQITGRTAAKISQITPIARLMAETEVVVTPKDSPFKTVKDLMEALKKDPKAVKFAGGSAGGIDHELAARLVKTAGGDVKSLAYVPFAGGGEAAAAILGGQVQVGISGYGEFKGHIDSGQMRALAVSSDAPLTTASSIPTIKSQGYDVVVVNWRLLAAPPEIPAADLAALKALAKKVHDSKTWQDFAKKNDWFENFSTDDLAQFLSTEEQAATATLTDLGLVK